MRTCLEHRQESMRSQLRSNAYNTSHIYTHTGSCTSTMYEHHQQRDNCNYSIHLRGALHSKDETSSHKNSSFIVAYVTSQTVAILRGGLDGPYRLLLLPVANVCASIKNWFRLIYPNLSWLQYCVLLPCV